MYAIISKNGPTASFKCVTMYAFGVINNGPWWANNILIIFLHIKVRVSQGAIKGLVINIEGFKTSVI